MRSFIGCSLFLSIVCLPKLAHTGQEPPAFRSEVSLVNITAVVHSKDGRLLHNLDKDDFEVWEDGSPQTIRFFAQEAELPLSLGLILDVSGSQEQFLKQHDRDVEAFLKAVLRPSDLAFALCFGNHLRLVSSPTSHAAAILDGLRRFGKGSRQFPEIGPKEERDLGTALYDALYFSLIGVLNSSAERRRALVVFSDGEDNSSEHDMLDVIEAAQNADTVIYCVRYTEQKHGRLTARNKYGSRVMKHLASLSGGADFDAIETRLDAVFAQINDELRSMYQLGYVSNNPHPSDSSFRKVTIRCRQAGATVRAKSGYYTTAELLK